MITLYEIPSSALVAEITDDYDERTSMLSFRYFFGWSGGTLMATFATMFLLVPTADISNVFNVEGHGQVGLVAAGDFSCHYGIGLGDPSVDSLSEVTAAKAQFVASVFIRKF